MLKISLSVTALALLLLISGGMIAPAWAEEGVRSTLPENVPVYRDEDFLQGRNPYYIRFAKGRSPAVEQAIEAGGGEVIHRLDIIDTVAVVIADAAAEALSSRQDVLLVEPVPAHSLAGQVVPWNIDQYQARDIWDKNRDGTVDPGAPDGSGMKFCIIDTGIYASHSDFVGVSMDGFSQITGETWDEDGNGHGTHVAGTANAVHNDIGVVGTMPGGAELIILKVFNNNGQWTANSSLGAAAATCRDMGANVLSMSLGGGFSTIENDLFQALYDDYGILNIAAAGNSGNTTRSYPASYDSVISVGAIDRYEIAAEFTQYPETNYDPDNPPVNAEWDVVEFAGGGANVLSTWPGPPTAPHGEVPRFLALVGNDSYDGVQIEESALGEVTGPLVFGGLCGPGSGEASWINAVVLCERGEFTFAQKTNEVRSNGGLGIVIFNNEPGDINFIPVCGGDCDQPSIPAIFIGQLEGQEMHSEHLGENTTVVADDGSNCDGCSGSYLAISGTSMATPGVAAAVGLIWDACGGPAELTPQQIRLLLRETARDLSGTHPGTGFVYGEGWDRVTGWGLPQLLAAQQRGNELYGSVCPIGMQVEPAELEVCGLDETATATFTLDDDFQGTADMSITGVPAGASASFDPNPVVHPAKDTVLTLSNLNSVVSSGVYEMEATATDADVAGNTAQGFLTMRLSAGFPAQPDPSAPADGSVEQPLRPTLSWTGSDANSYLVEIATGPDFNSVVYTASVTDTSHTVSADLSPSTTHYWRVTAANYCGDSPISATFSFTTVGVICETVMSNDVPMVIEDAAAAGGGTPTTSTSVLTSVVTGNLDAVRVVGLQGSHPHFSDLTFDLISPADTTVRIMDSSCTATNLSFNLNLDDNAAGTWPCPPDTGGTYLPSNPLADFGGETADGNWSLAITDNERRGGGAADGNLEAWGLDLCVIAEDPVDNPVPVLTAIDPDLTLAGSGSFTLTATGSDFVSSSVLRWNGADRFTTFVNATTLTANIPAGDVDTAGTADVTVFTPGPGGGTSAAQVFTILDAPQIEVIPASLSAVLAPDQTENQTLTIFNHGDGTLEWFIEEPTATVLPTPQAGHLTGDWSEGFEDISTLSPAGWAMINNSEPLGTTGWFQGNDEIFGAHQGPVDSYIAANFNNTAATGTISNWLLTPEMALNNGTQLVFYTRKPAGSIWPDRLEVRMSTAGDSTNVGIGAEDVGDFGEVLLIINPNLTQAGYPDAWTEYLINLSDLPAGDTTGRLAFRYYVTDGGPDGANSDFIGIDTVSVTQPEMVACENPEDVPWLSVDQADGTIAGGGSSDVTVTFDNTGLVDDFYEALLCVNSNDPANPIIEVPVTMDFAIITDDVFHDRFEVGAEVTD